MPDKTIVQVPVKKEDFMGMNTWTNEDGAMVATGSYLPKDPAGKAIGPARQVNVALGHGHQTAIENIISNALVPAANAQEGT